MDALVESGHGGRDCEDLTAYVDLFVEEFLNGTIDPVSKDGVPPNGVHLQMPLFPPHSKDILPDDPATPDDPERALIEQLIAATNLYETSEAVHELLCFTTRLRAFAPFNALLLHIQKPGLTHAATAHDWWERFKRVPNKGTRPLLILRTMGPVDFVFDILDTDGPPLPEDAFSFPTLGNLSAARFASLMDSVAREGIDVVQLDAGDDSAGWIRLVDKSKARKGRHRYRLSYNKNHSPATCFVTVAHELAHLFLGHLGEDPGRRIPDNRNTPHDLCEVEAEMTAYLVAKRSGLTPRSESYLSNYRGALKELNLYGVMRAANAVETALGISAHQFWMQKGNP